MNDASLIPGLPSGGVDSDALFRIALEAMPQGIVVFDAQGTMALVNPALERQFGYRTHDLIGQPVAMLLPGVPGELGDLRWTNGSRALSGRRADGTLCPVEIALRPAEVDGRPFVICTVADIPARQVAEVAPFGRVRDQPRLEEVYLDRDVEECPGPGGIIGQSRAIRSVLEQVRQVASTDSTVLLLGETGTGKELVATYLHDLSTRRAKGMVRVNCAAIPATLIESELFGREKGAFTGSISRQVGRFELADRSTIFLDEIGDLPLDVQIKLLRVLEQRQIERLGSSNAIHVDVRIVAATHRDLEQRIAGEFFREDLFYRLNVFPISVPPLRDRLEDLPQLIWRFVDEFSKAFGKKIDAISGDSMAALERYAWPGNIRELRNVVERAMVVATGPRLTLSPPRAFADAGLSAARRSTTLTDLETEHIRHILDAVGWRIRGVGGAAERLGLKPTTLETRMAKLGIVRPRAMAGGAA